MCAMIPILRVRSREISRAMVGLVVLNCGVGALDERNPLRAFASPPFGDALLAGRGSGCIAFVPALWRALGNATRSRWCNPILCVRQHLLSTAPSLLFQDSLC